MTNEQMTSPTPTNGAANRTTHDPSMGTIWGLLWFGALGLAVGYALLFGEGTPIRVFAIIVIGVCGTMLSTAILALGVFVGIRAAIGQPFPTSASTTPVPRPAEGPVPLESA